MKNQEENNSNYSLIIFTILIIIIELLIILINLPKNLNEIIEIVTTIFVVCAFYTQYNANQIQKEHFNKELKEQRKITQLQQFENQFYEMLRLHKENVNEIEIEIKARHCYQENKVLNGRLAFLEMKNRLLRKYKQSESEEDFKKAYYDFFWSDNFHSYLGHYYRHLYHTVKFVVNQKEEIISEKQKLNYLRILRAQLSNYEQEMLFYNWLSGYGNAWEEISIEEKVIYLIDDNKNKEYIKELKDIYINNKEIKEKNEILRNVINDFLRNENFPKENKDIELLKNQIEETRKEQNQFFTKYKMIQNLWYDKLSIKDNFIKDNLKILVKRYKELEGKNSLFEIGDNIDEKF